MKSTKNIVQVKEEGWRGEGGEGGREKEQQPQLELCPETGGSQTSFKRQNPFFKHLA